MTTPFDVRYSTSPLARPTSPFFCAVLGEARAGGSVPAGDLTEITAANQETLGSDGVLRVAYDYLTRVAGFRFIAAVYETGEDGRELDDVIGLFNHSGQITAKLGGYAPSVVVMPEVGSAGIGTDSHITTLAGIGARENRRIAAMFVDANETDPVGWAGNNSHLGVVGVANKGDFAGATPATSWGSIAAAGHFLRHVTPTTLGRVPFNLAYPVLGAGDPRPAIPFDPENLMAEAETYDAAHLTSLIRYEGGTYLWGGKTGPAGALSAFSYPTHRAAAFELTKIGRHIMLPYAGNSVDTEAIDTIGRALGVAAEDYLEQGFISGYSFSEIGLVGRNLHARMELDFPDIIESAVLDITT